MKKRDEVTSTGFFTMDVVNKIMACRELTEAKQLAHEAVDTATKARAENIMKARRMIDGSQSVFKLGDNIVRGFMLAHLGLKAIK